MCTLSDAYATTKPQSVKGAFLRMLTFHFTPRRIEAHVCICFVALKVYKELERLLKLSGCPYSVDETLKIAETIVTIEIARPENKDTITKTLCLTEEERAIAYLIDTDDWLEL